MYEQREQRPDGDHAFEIVLSLQRMKRETTALLEAFEDLPLDEKRVFANEILRRSLPFDSGALEDKEIDAGSAVLFRSLDEEDADASTG